MSLFALGAWSVAFATCIPGYVIVRLFGLRQLGPVFALPFALSAMANCGMVYVLTAVGLYTQPVLMIIALPFTLAAIILFVLDPDVRFDALVGTVGRGCATAWLSVRKRPAYSMFVLLAVGGAVATVVQLVMMTITHGWSVFFEWDAVVSWNRWAKNWSSNALPLHIYHYPQLLPALWSVTYVLMGDASISLFATTIKCVFWFGLMESLAFYFVRRGDMVGLAAIPAAYWLVFKGIGVTAQGDMADVPVAFFALLSVVIVLRVQGAGEPARRVAVMWVSILVAAGAAMTKQTGLYVLAVVPVLFLLFSARVSGISQRLRATWQVGTAVLVGVLLTAPAYIYAQLTILDGSNSSEIPYVLGSIFGDSTYIEIIQNAVPSLFNRLGPYGYIIGALAVLSVVRPQARSLLLLICLPFSLIWATSFSYDARNLALALPFWAMCGGAGASVLVGWLLSILGQEAPPLPNDGTHAPQGESAARRSAWVGLRPYSVAPAVVILGLLGAGLLLGSIAWDRPAMAARQDRLLVNLGGQPQITKAVLQSTEAFAGSPLWIVSEWRWACVLPEIFGVIPCRRTGADIESSLRAQLKIVPRSWNAIVVLYESSLTPGLNGYLAEQGFQRTMTVPGRLPTAIYERKAE